MDQAAILKFLATAEAHVADGEVIVSKQRLIVERQARDGQDTNIAEALLRQFERAQALHIADRDRLRIALANTT
jgi:hypothetical protein